jgi:hypothetical protein
MQVFLSNIGREVFFFTNLAFWIFFIFDPFNFFTLHFFFFLRKWRDSLKNNKEGIHISTIKKSILVLMGFI